MLMRMIAGLELWLLSGVFVLALPSQAVARSLERQVKMVAGDELSSQTAAKDAADITGDLPIDEPMQIESHEVEEISGLEAQAESPLRFSVAYEYGYKVQRPERTIKNRASLRLEYGRTLSDSFSVQFDAKANVFLGNDQRRAADNRDIMVTQAYLQSSFGKTSFRAGIQTLPWGESMLAPITDEISPRDNRELFNFNLEELRIGQPMLVVDRYTDSTRWSGFVVPQASFNKLPEDGTLYDLDPLSYRRGSVGEGGPEYGVSWKKNYDRADITLMAASLVDNDYARRLDGDGLATRVRERFTLTGMSFSRAMGNFVLRGEAAVKFGKPFNDQALQIVLKRTIETYVGLDYRPTPTMSMSAEVLNQQVFDWETDILGVPKNRQTGMLSLQKNLMNDDLSITLQAFGFWPNASTLSMLLTSWKVNDNLALSMNVAVPSTNSRQGSLWTVRDQKQALFKIQWQF